jgi:anthranilate synthase component II
MKLLIFDNYDSFTYNLLHLVEKVGEASVEVHRNDEISISEIERFDKILLSPGPGLPKESGILCELVEKYAPTKSILGVCLGLQAIGEVFGGTLVNLEKVYHGLATPVHITAEDKLFTGIPQTFKAGRYHSWVIGKTNFPDALQITAEDENGFIMAAKHKQFDVRGVQFHPESILSEYGEELISNWIKN